MLVMVRRVGEELVIGDDIFIRIININPLDGSVKLSFDAPRNIPIHREEIFDAVQNEGRKHKLSRQERRRDSTSE